MEFASESNLQKLREILLEQGIDAFIVGSGDAHLSEYVSDADLRRGFISGFDGSAGTALILQDKALLWTDGRYFLQADKQLSPQWTLMKSGQPGVPEMAEWVGQNLASGQCVGVDSMLIPVSEASTLHATFARKGVVLKGVTANPVDNVWAATRPAVPPSPILVMDLSKTGKSHDDKIADVRVFIATHTSTATGTGAMLVTALDDVAWLLNFRGSDITHNPVALAYALVTMSTTYLFIDTDKVTEEAREHWGGDVIILPYTQIAEKVTQQALIGTMLMDFNQG
jgi:Xaa-Pro aminopeptidase